MARTAGAIIGKLSAAKVNALTKPGMYNDGANLYLKIDEGGSKSWILRYKVHGRPRKYGIGATHTVGLALAREKAAAARRLLLDGIDPIEARKTAKAAARLEASKTITFDDCAKKYIEENKASWKSAKHTSEWNKSLQQHVSPVFGKLRVADIDRELILRALKPIWTTKHETASRIRQRIERVLNFAKSLGYRQGENPAVYDGNLEHALAKPTKQLKNKQNHPALPFAELPEFMAKVRESDEIAAHALTFTILTTARTGEVIGAKWNEIDFKESKWTVPGIRMKSGVDHIVPLTPLAIKLLRRMDEIGQLHHAPEYVFPSDTNKDKPMLAHGMRSFLYYYVRRRDIAVHGFRSSFKDWAAERGYRDEVSEAQLAHVVPNKVKAAYLRTKFIDERRKMLDAWATYISTPASDGSKVIPIRRRK